jgi:hypothetical protein
VHPLSLAQAILPLPIHRLPLEAHWRALLFDSREPFLASIYLGTLSLALAAAAWVGPRRRGRGLFTSAAVLATLAALGKHTPFYDLLTTVAFPLRFIRYPAKAMVPAAFAWALVAGMGYDAWRERPGSDARRWRLGLALPLLALGVAAAAAALAGWLGSAALGPRLLDPGVSAAKAGELLAPMAARLAGAALACLGVAGLAWMRVGGLRAASAVAALAAFDLWIAHVSLNPTVPRKVLTYRPATLDYIDQRDGSRLYVYEYFGVKGKSERYLKQVPLEEQERLWARWPYPYSEIVQHRTSLLPPVGEIWRLFGSFDMDMRGLYPVPQARLALLLRAIEGTPGHLRVLRIGAVSRLVAFHTEGLEELVPLATLVSITGSRPEPIRVYGVPDSVPRAYVVSGNRVADGHDAFVALVDPDFDARREVILAEGLPSPPDPSFAGTARISSLTADRVRLDVELSAPGYAVLVDAYDPGWRARVDGAPARVLRANVAFRAVPVAAGRHVVELIYRPPSVLIGLAITTAGVLAAAAAAWPHRRDGSR